LSTVSERAGISLRFSPVGSCAKAAAHSGWVTQP
jgi:hypothetical protein